MAYVQLPEVLLKTDTNKLKKLLKPVAKKEYSKWFLKRSQIFENVYKSSILTILKNTNTGDTSRIGTVDILEYDYVPLTFEKLQNIKINNIKQISKTWSRDRLAIYLQKIACELYSEERVDVVVNKAEDTKLYVMIHYPEIKITNSVELEHTMRDVYVKYDFELSSTYGWKLAYISLSRTTFEVKELITNYIFSHIHTQTNPVGWGSGFCYGYTEFSNFIGDIYNNPDETNFIDFFPKLLLAFDEYLQWESLEGVPHISISRLFESFDVSALRYAPAPYLDPISEEILRKVLDTVPLSYEYIIIDGKYNVILTENTIENIRNLLTTQYPSKCYIWHNGNSYVKGNTQILEKANKYNGVYSAVTFKGEAKKVSIIDIDDFKEVEYEYSIHKNILNFAVTAISLKLKNYLINKQLGWKPKEILVQEP